MILDYVINTNYTLLKSHDVIIGRYNLIGEILPQILGIGHPKNGLDFLSRYDASSIPRNWIFGPKFTDRG